MVGTHTSRLHEEDGLEKNKTRRRKIRGCQSLERPGWAGLGSEAEVGSRAPSDWMQVKVRGAASVVWEIAQPTV